MYKTNYFILIYIIIFLGCKDSSTSTKADKENEAEEKVTKLTSGDSEVRQVQYSPDGKFITYTSDKYGKTAIYTKDIAIGSVKQISEPVNWISGLQWSPDGKSIILRRTSSSSALMAMKIDYYNFKMI
jgi:Tol biopolymer transport system component